MRARMHRVLVLAYDFPPCRAPGAAVRTAKFVRYLPELGWETVVVCRDDGTEPEEASDDVFRIPAPAPDRVSYQLAAWSWALRVRGLLRRLLWERPFDLVYMTGPPFAPVWVAAELRRAAGIPFVVDFRDSWSFDPFEAGAFPKRILKRALRTVVYPTLERRVFSAADAVVTNTPSMERAMTAPPFRVTSTLIPNGYDEEDFAGDVTAHRPRGEIELLYCGRFNGIAARSAEPVLRALRTVADSGRRIRLRVVGDASRELRGQVARAGVEELVEMAALVPYPDAIRQIREADALLLVQAQGHGPVTPIAGKTFEYLRSGRPLLAVVPEGDNADLVRDHGGEYRIASPGNPDDIARALGSLADVLPSSTRPPSAAFRRFERRALTIQLAKLFDSLVPESRR